jgi:hypothetical protein
MSIAQGSRDVDRPPRRRDTTISAAHHSRSIVHSGPQASSVSRVTASRNRTVNPSASSNSPGLSASPPVSGASGRRVMPRPWQSVDKPGWCRIYARWCGAVRDVTAWQWDG